MDESPSRGEAVPGATADAPGRPAPTIDRHRLRLLAVLAAPVCNETGDDPPSQPLDVWGEWERLKLAASIRDPESRRGVPWSLYRLAPPTRARLADHLSLGQRQEADDLGYQVVHFGCHGCADGLFLEDDLGRESFVSKESLAAALRGHGLRLAVFNACDSEAVARELVKRGVVEAAVAAHSPIRDDEAKLLAKRLYGGLAVGRTVARALEVAKEDVIDAYRKDWPPYLDKEGHQLSGRDRADNILLLGDGAVTLEAEPPVAAGPSFIDQETPSNEPLPRENLVSFVGRHDELHGLARWLNGTGRPTFAITGVGGVGKTTLALNAALRAAHGFDALVFASAKDTPDFGCRRVLEKMAGAKLPAPRPEEERNLTGAVTRRLNRFRVLLILDNLEDLEEARRNELAEALGGVDPHGGSRILMTLRPREMDPLTRRVPQRDRLDLQTLDPPSALRLVWERCLMTNVVRQIPPNMEATPEERNEIERLAATAWLGHLPDSWLILMYRLATAAFHHPKLIHLAVSMVERKGWEKTFLRLHHLRGARLQDALQELIGRMVDDLQETSPAAMDVLQAALVFRGGADGELLRHVALGHRLEEDDPGIIDWEDGPLQAALDASLLSRLGVGGDRYDLDPPVRGFLEAHRSLDPEERGELELRHAKELVPVVQDVTDGWLEGRYSLTALPEWSNLTLAWERLAAADPEENRRAAELLVAFSHHWGNVLRNGYEPERLDWMGSALDAARQIGDQTAEANTLRALGDVHWFQDNLHDAQDHYQQALQLFRDVGDRRGEANALKALGDVLRFQKNLDSAHDHYQQALQLCRDVGDRRSEANALKALGDVLWFQDNLHDAHDHYQQALQLFRDIGSRLGEANALQALGDVLRFQDNLHDAQDHYQQALQLYRDIGDRLGEANTLQALGDVLRFQGNPHEAQHHYQQALQLYRDIGDRLGEANSLSSLGINALLRNQEHLAEELLEQAVEIYRQIGDRYSEAAHIGNYGWALLREKREAEAHPYLVRAAELFDEIGLEDYAKRHRRAADEINL